MLTLRRIDLSLVRRTSYLARTQRDVSIILFSPALRLSIRSLVAVHSRRTRVPSLSLSSPSWRFLLLHSPSIYSREHAGTHHRPSSSIHFFERRSRIFVSMSVTHHVGAVSAQYAVVEQRNPSLSDVCALYYVLTTCDKSRIRRKARIPRARCMHSAQLQLLE